MTDPQLRKTVEAVTRNLTEEGRIIEAGWMGYRLLVIPVDAPRVQIEESRNAFYAGAQHLWSSMFSALEREAEPTDGDERRLSLIHAELDRFVAQFKARHGL